MADKHNISISFDIKKDDGSPFMDAGINYYGMGYEKMVAVEAVLSQGVVALVDLGKAEVEAQKEVASPNGVIR